MSKLGMWTAKELMQPTSRSAFAAMLWWAAYFVSVIEIAVFCFNAVGALFFEKKLLWDRELVVLAISLTVVVCYHLFGKKKKAPIQPPVPTRGNGM